MIQYNSGVDTNLPPVMHYRVAALLHQARKYNEMNRALEQCLSRITTNTPPEPLLRIAKMYAETGQPEKTVLPMQEYLKRKPDDWKAWLDLALVQWDLGNTNEAAQALEKAIEYGGWPTKHTIEKDHRFGPIADIIGYEKYCGTDFGCNERLLLPSRVSSIESHHGIY